MSSSRRTVLGISSDSSYFLDVSHKIVNDWANVFAYRFISILSNCLYALRPKWLVFFFLSHPFYWINARKLLVWIILALSKNGLKNECRMNKQRSKKNYSPPTPPPRNNERKKMFVLQQQGICFYYSSSGFIFCVSIAFFYRNGNGEFFCSKFSRMLMDRKIWMKCLNACIYDY